MRSIQLRLVLLLALTLTVLSAAAGGGLYAYLRHAMRLEFDASVDSRRKTFQSLVTVKETGQYDVDIHPETRSAAVGGLFDDSFRITAADGRVVTAAGRIAVPDPAGHPAERPFDATFADGSPARVVWATFRPHREVDEQITAELASTPLTVVYARDRRSLDRAVSRAGLSIAVAVLGLSCAAVAATAVIVRGGLGKLRRLAADAEAIDVARPDAKFETKDLSDELRPIAARLNDMLGRVAETMARERRFSSDVAHELRTPIAELRTAAEVALRCPDDPALTTSAVRQARDIAVQMQTVVSVLLSIVRQDRRTDLIAKTPINLRAAVTRVVQRPREDASRIDVGVDVDSSLNVLADATLLDAILTNLFNNACQYGTNGIYFDADAADGIVTLRVENAQSGLKEADLARLFDPFWRKDSARSDGQHVGLGLTLVRAYCRVLDASVSASLPATDRFRMSLRLPAVDAAVSPEGVQSTPLGVGH